MHCQKVENCHPTFLFVEIKLQLEMIFINIFPKHLYNDMLALFFGLYKLEIFFTNKLDVINSLG